MTPQQYLSRAGLAERLDAQAIASHAAAYQELGEASSGTAHTDALYSYRVPELGENGACSLPDQLADAPYDLAATLGGRTPDATAQLVALNRLAELVQQETGCGWIGIYQSRDVADGRALVKLAYRGKPSRAEFPLTAEFAVHSNNSAVGLSGRGRIIANVEAYLAEGGAYYTCDAEVQSEACLPLFDEAGTVIGIVDAEDARRDFFRGAVLERIVALCMAAPGALPG